MNNLETALIALGEKAEAVASLITAKDMEIDRLQRANQDLFQAIQQLSNQVEIRDNRIRQLQQRISETEAVL